MSRMGDASGTNGRRLTSLSPKYRASGVFPKQRKSVVYLFRYREICLQSNSRYLNALAQVDDPTPGLRALDVITSRKQPLSARPVKAFNPLLRPDSQLFAALMSGEHTVHGFTNRDLRDKLAASVLHLDEDRKKGSAQVSRLLQRLHVHGLVARSPAHGAGGSPPSATE